MEALIAFIVACVGWVVCMCMIAAEKENRPVTILGFLMLVGGIICVFYLAFHDDGARRDRARRTRTVTDVVVEETKSLKGDQEEWFESFKLKQTPYTFSFKRDKFCQWGVNEGDVVKVTFVAPKKPDGQPELLDVYNLDSVIERVKYSSPALEALPPCN